MRWPIPSREPTPAEYVVLVWFVSLVFIILGLVALVTGLLAPAEKHALAVALEHRGIWCLLLGLGIQALYWLYRRLVD